MLKARLITAAILLPLVIGAIVFLPTLYIEIISGVFFALATWEWVCLMGFAEQWKKICIFVLFLLIAGLCYYARIPIEWVCWTSLGWWLIGLLAISFFPKGRAIWKQTWLQLLIGCFMLIPAWLVLSSLHADSNFGPLWVLLCCALIWGADTGAYFSGKKWGQNKLLATVSPGKTWEGFYGALGTGVILTGLFYVLTNPNYSFILLLWVCILTVLFSVIGDLVESLFKRVQGIKDSGGLLPGHGGVLDRLDSMLSAFPIFVLGLKLLENIQLTPF